MSVEGIKESVCRYFNGLDGQTTRFIKSPTNAPAPVGKYVSVGVDDVSQYGSRMTPGPGTDSFRFSQVATLHFVEVEGDGETLRGVRNEVQLPRFAEYARQNGFTVWEWTDIEKIDTYDGEFYVRQWRFTCTVNFTDETVAELPRIETVDPLEIESK